MNLFPNTMVAYPAMPAHPSRPWFASYGPGVPHSIEDRISGTINDLFERSVRTYANNRLIESFGVGLTYAKAGEIATSIAAWLQAQPKSRFRRPWHS